MSCACPQSRPERANMPDSIIPPRPRQSVISRVTRPIQVLPMRVRLVALLVSLLLVALTLTSFATSALMRRQLMDSIDRDLRAAAIPTAAHALIHRTDEAGIPTNYAVKFIPTNGDSPYGSLPTGEHLQPDIPNLTLTDARVQHGTPFTVNSVNGVMRWRVIPGVLSDGSATFAVAVPLRGLDTTVDRMLTFSILIGLAVIASCALLGWYGVRRAFRPLSQMEDTAAAIAAGDLARRIPEPAAKDELASLARSLNAMLAQIEQSFAVRQASEERMSQFVAESIRMGGLVNDLLILTRLDRHRPLERGPVDLTVLAADAVQDARALDPTRHVRLLGLSGDLQPTTIEGDEAKLRQVVNNLVGNAVNHTPEGTGIEIAVGSGAPGHARLEVRDHGDLDA